MLSPKLYKASGYYNAVMKLLGYERGIDLFLKGIDVQCEPGSRVLDAGCGTGMMGLHFLERFPGTTLLATDLEPNFLTATLGNAKSRESRQIESKSASQTSLILRSSHHRRVNSVISTMGRSPSSAWALSLDIRATSNHRSENSSGC